MKGLDLALDSTYANDAVLGEKFQKQVKYLNFVCILVIACVHGYYVKKIIFLVYSLEFYNLKYKRQIRYTLYTYTKRYIAMKNKLN